MPNAALVLNSSKHPPHPERHFVFFQSVVAKGLLNDISEKACLHHDELLCSDKQSANSRND